MWYSSPTETGLRQLLIVALLRPFLEQDGESDSLSSLLIVQDLERFAAQVIAFYTASLPDDIEHANLDFFAAYYADPNGAYRVQGAQTQLTISVEIQQAARMLFDSALDRMSEQEIQDLVTQYQPSRKLSACL
jgi:hypothetical protein